MPFLHLGNKTVSYEIKRSNRARRMRITVRPGRVLVTAPRFTLRRTAVAFVESKREWIFGKVAALGERPLAATPDRFVSGARILFRGRHLRLRVEANGAEASLRFASCFQVTVPAGLTAEQREAQARKLVMDWLAERVLDDARKWCHEYGSVLGVRPTRIRLGDQKSIWGSCSVRGVIALNWRLITTPKHIFEYVVVHELCHLVEHNHGRRFWKLVESLIPDYRERRAWLRRHGVALA